MTRARPLALLTPSMMPHFPNAFQQSQQNEWYSQNVQDPTHSGNVANPYNFDSSAPKQLYQQSSTRPPLLHYPSAPAGLDATFPLPAYAAAPGEVTDRDQNDTQANPVARSADSATFRNQSISSSPTMQSTSPQTAGRNEVQDDESGSELDDGGENDRGSQPPMSGSESLIKKRKMKRFRLTHNQTRFLMSEFARQPHPDAAHRERLSREIPGLNPRQVQVWFQNRRAKLKRLTVDDRERMLRSRALPADFDNTHTLRSPFVPQQSTPESSASNLAPSTLRLDTLMTRYGSFEPLRRQSMHEFNRVSFASPDILSAPAGIGGFRSPYPAMSTISSSTDSAHDMAFGQSFVPQTAQDQQSEESVARPHEAWAQHAANVYKEEGYIFGRPVSVFIRDDSQFMQSGPAPPTVQPARANTMPQPAIPPDHGPQYDESVFQFQTETEWNAQRHAMMSGVPANQGLGIRVRQAPMPQFADPDTTECAPSQASTFMHPAMRQLPGYESPYPPNHFVNSNAAMGPYHRQHEWQGMQQQQQQQQQQRQNSFDGYSRQ